MTEFHKTSINKEQKNSQSRIYKNTANIGGILPGNSR